MQENNNEIVSLNNLVTEIKFFENQVVNSYWEIGKRLSQAKQQVGHGNWINWVNDNLGYTRQTASNLIKVYETYPNGNSSLHLNFKQALALTSIDEEIREEILKNEKLEDKSVKETKEIIEKYREEIREQKQVNIDLENKNIELKEVNKILAEKLNNGKVVKEVIEPDDYEILKNEREYFKKQSELLEKSLDDQKKITKDLELRIQEEKSNIDKLQLKEKQEKLVMDMNRFVWDVNSFLQKVGGLLYLTDRLEDVKPGDRKLFIQSTKAMTGWAHNLYENIKKWEE